MRHGQWSEGQWGSLHDFILRDRAKACRDCTHRQSDHDDDGECELCNCTQFEYEEVECDAG